jgi:type IV pilus assembly protein PilQ
MTTIKTNIVALALGIFGLMAVMAGCASQPAQQPAAENVPAVQRTAITGIGVSNSDETTEVIISADGPLTFSSLKQPDPLAVVLYFPDSTVDRLAGAPSGSSPLIKGVTARDNAGSQTARIEIQLAQDVPYTAQKTDSGVRLTFVHADLASATAAPQPMAAQAPMDRSAAPGPSTAEPASSAVAPTAQVSAPQSGTAGGVSWVNKVEFLNETDGKSTLIVGTTRAVEYRINKVAPKKVEIRLLDTRIPAYRQRPLITTRFTSAVDRIMPYQPSAEIAETLISIELREAVPYVAEQTDNLLMVHFEPSSIPPKPLEQAQLPEWKRVMSEPAMPSREMPVSSGDMVGGAASVPGPATGAQPIREDELIKEDIEIRSLLAPRKRQYTGEKIALDFYDTDVKNVFRILREVSGKNFAIDKDVTGKVTMTLDKPVPWDQVMDLVLRMNQLGMTHEGDIVRIATLETLKKEDDLRKAKLEALRQAQEDAKALEPLVTRYIPVSYSNAGSEVMPHIEKILTTDRGSVTVDAKNNQVIITDTMAKVRQAEEIIRKIDKVTAQVVIEARVVEVSHTFSKELGITWDASYGPGVIDGLEWATSTDMAMNFPSSGANSSIGISFSRLSGVPFVLNARLNALETTGEGRILSAPKILTLDNKKASIKQGVEYAYPERDSSGGQSVKFKNIDLLLEVTPHVTPDNRISLILFITKNDVAGVTGGVPSVATNEAKTELLVNDGDTVVIGGIIKSTANTGKSAFPGLHRIPVLGWLFQNNSETEQSNELLIFITPRIVQLEQALVQ